MSGNRSQQSFASQHENPCIVIAQPQLSRIPNSEPHNLDSLNASNRRALLHPTTSSVIEGKIKSSSFIKSRRGTIVSSEPVVNIFDYASHPQNQIQGPRLSICAQPENLAANIPDIQPTLSGTEFRVSQEQDEDHRLRRRRSINSRFYFCMHDRGGVDAIKNTKSNLILESNVTEDYSGDILSNHGIVKLNISGTLFHVRRSTLENDPLVYQGILEQAIWLEQRREYYLERDPMVFRFVFHYLRFGDLHLPGNLCGPFLEKELQSWGIQMGFEVQRCCLGAVMETKVNLDSLKHFEQDLRGENIKPRHMIR
ncbi:unnamed protein product [Protopolystoma xenopodis]|uniref:Potassium channel tetramerisation-type BTB domain-containing protein n=1 Tax=Protopolystoma xenopodis TaxID=117903 RepID=A0A448X0M9_9PLAT|nr:unnamed protein product [Protopolystoma xenopodis]